LTDTIKTSIFTLKLVNRATLMHIFMYLFKTWGCTGFDGCDSWF